MKKIQLGFSKINGLNKLDKRSMVRIEGMGHHFERYHRKYCIVVVVVVVVVADNANYSEKKT